AYVDAIAYGHPHSYRVPAGLVCLYSPAHECGPHLYPITEARDYTSGDCTASEVSTNPAAIPIPHTV
ncbi:MAG: hypothetical protein J7M34_08580, partial [Anaerolineae bacterium]|nr:hypothetical protein [Anaerolineae bacterium]